MLYQSIRTLWGTGVDPELAITRAKLDLGLVILDQAVHAKLYQTILSRGFAHMVTDFLIRFVKCNYIQNLRHILQRCICDEFDATLGQTMLSL